MMMLLLKYWKQLVVMIGCFLFGVWITNNHYSAVISDMKATQAEVQKNAAIADLQSYKDAANSMKDAAVSARIEKDNTDAKLNEISKQLKIISIKKPLPSDCKPDADRVQSLQQAIDITNQSIR
jgi:hypothetical protein